MSIVRGVAVVALLTLLVGTPSAMAGNSPPGNPAQPSGPYRANPGTGASYSTTASDPDNEMIRIEFDWGDDSQAFTGWAASGGSFGAAHAWADAGHYCVKARAWDISGTSGLWSACRMIAVHASTPLDDPERSYCYPDYESLECALVDSIVWNYLCAVVLPGNTLSVVTTLVGYAISQGYPLIQSVKCQIAQGANRDATWWNEMWLESARPWECWIVGDSPWCPGAYGLLDWYYCSLYPPPKICTLPTTPAVRLPKPPPWP